jgi:formate hydrogenlyase subunit 3/multisubunit Na+/H+ antiporter MnhD subunit
LLVSPSVVSYLIREQFYGFVPKKKQEGSTWKNRLFLSVYIWSLKEWNLDRVIQGIIFQPLKKLGHRLDFLRYRTLLLYFIPSYAVGVYLLVEGYILPHWLHQILPVVFAFLALLMVLKSFTERRSIRLAWTLLWMNHFWMVLAIAENENFAGSEVGIYLSGVIFFGAIGWVLIHWMTQRYGDLGLYGYQGYVRQHPLVAFLFLMAVLGLIGFPISPTFIGEDLLFSHIHEDQFVLAFLAALAFVMEGVAAIRIYARLFFGTVPESSALSSSVSEVEKSKKINTKH